MGMNPNTTGGHACPIVRTATTDGQSLSCFRRRLRTDANGTTNGIVICTGRSRTVEACQFIQSYYRNQIKDETKIKDETSLTLDSFFQRKGDNI